MAEPLTPDEVAEIKRYYTFQVNNPHALRLVATVETLTAERDEWAARAIENARLATQDADRIEALTARLDAIETLVRDAEVNGYGDTGTDEAASAYFRIADLVLVATADPTPPPDVTADALARHVDNPQCPACLRPLSEHQPTIYDCPAAPTPLEGT